MGEAMGATLGKLGLSDQAERLRIVEVWREAVGARIAERTTPHAFSRHVLTVKASSAAWQNELTFLKGTLIARLNELLGTALVREIKVISGHLSTASLKRERRAPAPSEAERRTAASVAESIPDDEVRDAFGRMMARHLAAKRRHVPHL